MSNEFAPPFADSGRSLSEIIDAAKDGVVPDHSECYYAMLAFDALLHFAGEDVQRLVKTIVEKRPSEIQEFTANSTQEEIFRREKTSFNKSPFQWLGIENIPGHPRQVTVRKIGKKILAKFMKDKG